MCSTVNSCSNKAFCLQHVWARFDVGRRGYIGLHNWKKFLAALKRAKCPLASKANYVSWERPICYEAWHCHQPNKGLQFSDAMLILLHDKFGRHVRTLPASLQPCNEQSVPARVSSFFTKDEVL